MNAHWMSTIATTRSRPTWTLQLALLGLLVLLALAYEPLNHHIGGTHDLATSLDHQIPVISLFAIPYLVFLPLFWLLVLYALLTNRLFAQLALTAIVVYACSDVVFATFHTFAPRPHIGTGFLNELVHFIYSHDEPYNDLPSEHTSSAVMFGLYFFATRNSWRVPLALFALLVVASTLFVKQHTIAGAAGGVLLAILAWITVSRLYPTLFHAEAGVEQDRLRDDREQNPGRDLSKSSTS